MFHAGVGKRPRGKDWAVLALGIYACAAASAIATDTGDANVDRLLPDASISSASSSFSVAAYLPEWRYEGANWEKICQYSTHLILFSLEVGPSGTVVALDRIPRPELLAEARAAATRHGTALLICFGGNGRSDGFSPMVDNPHTV